MELEITKKEKNPLLFREEIEAVVVSETTPSYGELKEELAKKLGKAKELVIIKHIYQKYGRPESTAKALVYENKEALKKFEGAKGAPETEGSRKVEEAKEVSSEK